MPSDEMNLLADYVANRSQPAFAAIVQRYVDLVYSAARRQLRGDAHLAEDVTQAVFIVLAQKAEKVPADRPLSAWLLKTTGYCAANARRSKLHREHYERKAAQMARGHEITDPNDAAGWDELSPMLDEGLNKLRSADRDALLLRFFEKKSLRDIGVALGISEEAAAKRVTRAVDRLRDYFRRRGVAVSAAVLPMMLTTHALQSAPAGIASAVFATSTGAGTGAAASVAKGAIAVMAVEKVKAVAAVAAVAVLGLATVTAVVVKATRSPLAGQTRQVGVAPIPVAAEKPLADVWPVLLRGQLADVLGITDHSATDAKWWTLDGKVIPAPADAGRKTVSLPSQPGRRVVRVLLSYHTLPADRQRAIALRPNVAGGVTRSRETESGRGSITEHVAYVDPGQQTAELALGAADSIDLVIGNISLFPGASTSVTVADQKR
jgi:RNA polymerase sigma factor (sigma-70 family)